MGEAAAITSGRVRRVLIIGAGVSGTLVAAGLLRRGWRAPSVTLIDAGGRFGPGLAYGQAAGDNLMNVRAGRLSAVPDDPAHFARWLKARGPNAEFPARRDYAKYIERALSKAAGARWPSALRRVRARAAACRREGEGWAVTLESGNTLFADAVVLALGAPPPPAPANAEGQLIEAWDQRAQSRLGRGDVLLLGTGLTMVDVALSLAERRDKGVIYALSRRGRIPLAHAPAYVEPAPAPALPAALSAALQLLRARARQSGDWRALVDGLREAAPDLWASLPLEAQRRFLRHLRPWWDSHRHRAAPEIARRLNALINAGRVRILAGELFSAVQEGPSWRVQHRQRGSLVRHRLEVAGVINCLGPDFELRNPDDLVRQLLQEGYARAPANGLGLEVDPHNRLRNAQGLAQPGLFMLGPLAIGSFWETLAIPELRARAAAIAALLG